MAPKRLKMDANSTPTAPAPMIPMRAWDGWHIQDFNIGENQVRVGLKPGNHASFRAGRHNYVLGFDGLGTFVGRDFDASIPLQPRITLDDVDFVLAHEKVDALGVFGDDLVLAIENAE